MKQKSVLVILTPISLPRLEGLFEYAQQHGWAIILHDRLPNGFDLSLLDGALVTYRGNREQVDLVRKLLRLGKPVVDLTDACATPPLTRVSADHFAVGQLAAQHFIEHGFENFAWYSSSWSNVHRLRYDGYRAAVGNRTRIIRTVGGDAALARLLTRAVRPLGILTYDETDASLAIRACQLAGLSVPADIAILAVGNDPFLCENAPIPLSSIDQGLKQGVLAAAAVLDRLMATDQPVRPTTTLIPPVRVVPRASTDTLAHPHPTIRTALNFIHRNLSKPLTSSQVAAAVGMPRSTLDHLFTAQYGRPIGREILRQRLLRAKRLLRDETIQLKAIAKLCGFCHSAHFTNVFKAETGLSPKAWRNS